MKLAWTRFIDGVFTWREENAFLLIYLLFFLWIYCDTKQIDNKNWVYYIKVSILTLIFPVTAIGFLMFYTPFYNWIDLHAILPSVLAVSYVLIHLCDWFLVRSRKCYQEWACLLCIGIVLLASTNGTGLKSELNTSVRGIPAEAYELLSAIDEVTSDGEYTIAARSDTLQYVRQYSEDFYPAYGLDLWDLSASSYVESAYTYEYELYDLMEQPYLDEALRAKLVDLVHTHEIDCLVIPAWWPEIEGLDQAFSKSELTSEYVLYFKQRT